MGFWDVLLFNIATVLGPRWIAAAGHNGTSSISLWVLAAVFFFVPGAFVINELSSRFPVEGGLYAWSREAFGPFHGFIAGWTYWIYTVFYFPGLLLASASMAAYIIGPRGAALAQDRTFLLTVSLGLLVVAVVLNIIGLNIGKWLQNAGGVGTYVPLRCWWGLRRWSAFGTARRRALPWPTCCPRGTGTRSTSGRRSPSHLQDLSWFRP
jgi:amino acid transporter